MSRAAKLELLALLEERARRAQASRYKTQFSLLYRWQLEFIAYTKTFTQVCLIAANRIGKTWTGTYMDAIHALGEYPDGWVGHKFDHAPLI